MQLAADFEVDPRYLQWKVSLHFLLRKRDVQALMVTVLLMKLPVSADKLPGRTKPFTALAGGGAAIRYADELVHRRDSNGVVSLSEVENAKETRVMSVMEIYTQTRMWIYTIIVIARGLELDSKLWVTPPAVLAWFEMLTVVAHVPSVGQRGFREYRDTSISNLTRSVNNHGQTLDAALLGEVAAMESNCATCAQWSGSSLQSSDVSNSCSNTECLKRSGPWNSRFSLSRILPTTMRSFRVRSSSNRRLGAGRTFCFLGCQG